MNDKGERPALTAKTWGTPLCALLKGGIMAGGAAVLLLLGSAFLLSAGVLREECHQVLADFFRSLRGPNGQKRDI